METKASQIWNNFVIQHNGSFLQSWEWGEFQQTVGKKVFYLEVHEMRGLVIGHALPLGIKYFYIPRGPVGEKNSFPAWFKKISEHAKQAGAVFLRIEPPNSVSIFQIPNSKFVDLGRAIQPRQNLIVDLAHTEDDLLAGMHEKTRYNIRLAGRHGVTTRVQGSGVRSQDVGAFLLLLHETAKEQDLKIYSDVYYQKMLEVFMAGDGAPNATKGILFFADYKGKPLATAFCVGFGRRLTYLHGGSSREHKNVMAPQLLHWEIMRWAKEAGYAEYDMGGIDEAKWPGLTRFKKGFGGRTVAYAGIYEYAYNRFVYSLYRVAHFLAYRS